MRWLGRRECFFVHSHFPVHHINLLPPAPTLFIVSAIPPLELKNIFFPLGRAELAANPGSSAPGSDHPPRRAHHHHTLTTTDVGLHPVAPPPPLNPPPRVCRQNVFSSRVTRKERPVHSFFLFSRRFFSTTRQPTSTLTSTELNCRTSVSVSYTHLTLPTILLV